MNPIGLLLVCLSLMLAACGGDGQPGGASRKTYFYYVRLPVASAVLDAEAVRANTLIPARKPAAGTPVAPAEPLAYPGFTGLSMRVLEVKALGDGVHRIRLEESPHPEGLLEVTVEGQEYRTLLLARGSSKQPLQLDVTATAAVDMFLSRVLQEQGFQEVDNEQVHTMLSVVSRYLASLDVPDALAGKAGVQWYGEQAKKACHLRFSALSSSAECAAFTLGGEVRGLKGNLQLVVNQDEPLQIDEDGEFMFRKGLVNRAHYEVAVREQPTNQTCDVRHGVGRIRGENVDSILVACEDNRYQLSGNAEGITGPVKLLLNGKRETLVLRRDGSFTFATKMLHGSPYEITLADQPHEMSCALSRGAGNIMDNVADIAVTCEPLLFQVGGLVEGLLGSLRLQLNNDEILAIDKPGEFAFGSDLVHKASYQVTIAEQPAGQTCTLARAAGRIALDDVRNVGVQCVLNQHRVGGVLAGARGPVTLLLNDTTSFVVSNNGEFAFPQALDFGSAFVVKVSAMPPAQQCEVIQGEGEITGDVSTIQVNCTTLRYRIGGEVSGLSGAFQLRLNNRQEVLAVPGNGPFRFATKLPAGERYRVEVDNQPAGQQCRLQNGSGRVGSADVSGLRVQCDFLTYKVGGAVSGLKGALKLALNGQSDTLSLASNGMFAFATALQVGQPYEVSVAVQPVGQVCEVLKGSGQINASNIVDVKVLCMPARPAGGTVPGGAGAATKTPPAPASAGAGDQVPDAARTFAAPLPEVSR